MTTSFLSIIIGIFILGILVFVHELGHFLVAKWCGIRVLTFSLGFGKALLSKVYNGTEYRISAIPFGGYVKMAGENPDDTRENKPDEFPARPVWQRALVAIAGPFANYAFAFALLLLMFLYGVERPLYIERPIIGAVTDSSVARTAGFKAGDSIVEINGHPVSSWEEIEGRLSRQDRAYTVNFYRGNAPQTLTMSINYGNDLIPGQPTGGLLPTLPAVVGFVNSGSPADKGGIVTGDTIRSIDGKGIVSWFQLLDLVRKNDGTVSMMFDVAGPKGTRSLSVTPQYDRTEKRIIIGIKVGQGKTRHVRYAFSSALSRSAGKSWEFTTMIFDVLGKLISRQVSVNQLSGPVGIIPASGLIALQGLAPILSFMALIGINLAVLNLLPLVITDGGLLLFLCIEWVRRKPLSINTQALINKIAIAFFLFLFVYITINDVRRLPEYFRFFGH